MMAFGVVFPFCAIRMLVRRDRIATALFAVGFGLYFGGLTGLTAGNAALGLVLLDNGMLPGWVAVQVVACLGLIALIVQMRSSRLVAVAVAPSPSAWYATPSFVSLEALVNTNRTGELDVLHREATGPNTWSVTPRNEGI